MVWYRGDVEENQFGYVLLHLQDVPFLRFQFWNGPCRYNHINHIICIPPFGLACTHRKLMNGSNAVLDRVGGRRKWCKMGGSWGQHCRNLVLPSSPALVLLFLLPCVGQCRLPLWRKLSNGVLDVVYPCILRIWDIWDAEGTQIMIVVQGLCQHEGYSRALP